MYEITKVLESTKWIVEDYKLTDDGRLEVEASLPHHTENQTLYVSIADLQDLLGAQSNYLTFTTLGSDETTQVNFWDYLNDNLYSQLVQNAVAKLVNHKYKPAVEVSKNSVGKGLFETLGDILNPNKRRA